MPHGFEAGKLQLFPARREITFDGRPLEVTSSEFNLLETLLRNGDTVTTKDELSLSASGRKRERYDRGVDVHISNLRKKLHVVTKATIVIETVRAIGYRLKVAG